MNEHPADLFLCQRCHVEKKENARGCLSPIKNRLWGIPYCPFCFGNKEIECHECNGNNEIAMYRCPRTLADSKLLPFFFVYRNSNNMIWPNGKGRLFQTRKLIEAFDRMTYHFNQHRDEK